MAKQNFELCKVLTSVLPYKFKMVVLGKWSYKPLHKDTGKTSPLSTNTFSELRSAHCEIPKEGRSSLTRDGTVVSLEMSYAWKDANSK